MTPRLESEVGWLAGIIDGEGWVGMKLSHDSRRGEVFGLYLSVANTSVELLQRCARIAGGVGYIHARRYIKNPKWRLCWTWTVSGAQAAEVCRLVGPYLVLKGPQCRLLLQTLPFFGEWGNNTSRRPRQVVQLRKSYLAFKALNRKGPRYDAVDGWAPLAPDHQLPLRLRSD